MIKVNGVKTIKRTSKIITAVLRKGNAWRRRGAGCRCSGKRWLSGLLTSEFRLACESVWIKARLQ